MFHLCNPRVLYTHDTSPFGLATFQGLKRHGWQLSSICTSQALTGVLSGEEPPTGGEVEL